MVMTMGRYTSEFRNAYSTYYNIGHSQRMFGYGMDEKYRQLNDQHDSMIRDVCLSQMESLFPQMIKEMESEVYQRVINDVKINVNMDSSKLHKSIQDAISSAFKGIG